MQGRIISRPIGTVSGADSPGVIFGPNFRPEMVGEAVLITAAGVSWPGSFAAVREKKIASLMLKKMSALPTGRKRKMTPTASCLAGDKLKVKRPIVVTRPVGTAAGADPLGVIGRPITGKKW